MNYTISQRVSEIFDLYTQLHEIRISLFNPEGKLIYPDAVGRPNCRYCTMLRDTLGMDSRCRAMDRKMMQVSLQRHGLVSYTCHAGMREAAAPVVVNEKLVGYVMLGQFRSEAAPTQSPYSEEWQAEQGNAALQKAYETTAVFPEHKIETLLSMFRHLLEFIIESQLIQPKEYDLIEPAIAQIHDRPAEPFSLADASRLIGRSPSSVTRLFLKATGRGFKQYQANYRMERAALLLKQSPGRPITEIARSVGFEDALYFSRVFRRHFGCSPSAFVSKKVRPPGANQIVQTDYRTLDINV
ncbi:MAG: PocR ligand-binding domain-containing protein [Pontiellaceae bacterium]|nr:PocR ligand-binding domain-containing protein [Pontiellaceae bacterium]